MWPFKQKKETPNHRLIALKEIEDFRMIGESFNYLGVEMTVTEHLRFVPGLYGLEPWPALVANYVNKLGEIKEISFAPRELVTLKNMNL